MNQWESQDWDDFNMDRLDYLADLHSDFFLWLETLMFMPEEYDVDWDLHITEPTPAELEMMDREAELILLDLGV